jgi:hypothetical protein
MEDLDENQSFLLVGKSAVSSRKHAYTKKGSHAHNWMTCMLMQPQGTGLVVIS